MYTLASDEKASTVMVYSQNNLVRGDVVTKQNMRVNIWLRTQGVPNYIHLLKAQVLTFGGTPPKSTAYNELFFPTEQIIGFHLAPPANETLDYDANEANRTTVDVQLMLGIFSLKCKVRISTHADFATSLEVGRAGWLSVYDAEITNPFLPQLNVQVPMLLVNPKQTGFALI